MKPDREQQETLDKLKIAAEQIISGATNQQVQIDKIDRLTEKGRRNLLLRCFIKPIKDLPSSFIIKKVETENYNPDNIDWDTRRFFNDWIGTQFLNEISSKHSPSIYGGDKPALKDTASHNGMASLRDLGFIIIEDVLHRNSLVESLLGNNCNYAEWALLKYATCLGQLHIDTLGKKAEFQELYNKVSPNMKPAKASVNVSQHKSRFENMGIEFTRDLLNDLDTIHQTVSNPGEFLVYIHGDACPDNVLDTGSQLRLIDFETGYFGHALIDAVFARMMFPSCWCSKRLPHKIVKQMEDTYRSILVQKCSVAEDDKIFESNLVDVCGFWLLDTLSRHFESALKKDEDFGISTIRQRILARLETFIVTSQEFNRLPGLRATSCQLLDLLRHRWSDTPELPFYPAFLSDTISL